MDSVIVAECKHHWKWVSRLRSGFYGEVLGKFVRAYVCTKCGAKDR